MSDLAVVEAYQRAYGRIRTRTVAQIAAAWQRAGGVSERDLADFLALVLPINEAADAATVALVDGYLATLTKSKPLGLDPKELTGFNLRGVDPAEVFTRPVVDARTALSRGSDYLDAMARGLDRATGLGEANVVLSQRAAMAEASTEAKRITGYRRVLTGASCSLCATASTQTYRRGSLMPIHQHCDCGVAPILDDVDPGAERNQRLLTDIRNQGPAFWDERGFGVDTNGQIITRDKPLGSAIEGPDSDWRNRKTVQVSVHTHGELGPVLTPKGEHFTGPSEIAA